MRRLVVRLAVLVALLAASLSGVFAPPARVAADQSEGGRDDLVVAQRKIAAGGGHTCVLLDTGRVQCWGANRLGEMGTDTVAVPTAPRLVAGVELATAITAGVSHTCALIQDGTVKCWGLNGSGQLGNGAIGIGHADEGVSVVGLDDAKAITAGGFHTCAIRESGSVVCWGHDGSGQLGNGDEPPLDPTGGTSLVPVPVTGITDAKAITAGEFHTCALLAGGTMKCWGSNGFGQLGNDAAPTGSSTPVAVSGIPDGDDRLAVAVAAGYGHTCAIVDDDTADALADSKLLCWGDNSQGQLGDNTKTNRSTPIEVQLDEDPSPLNYDPADFVGSTSVTAGQFHTCVRRFGGTSWCWGNASRGQIGNGTTGDAFAAEAPDKQMWKTPQQAGASGVSAITAGGFHTCALSGTAMSCWGFNHHGQLGRREASNPTPIPVTSLAGATTVATGTTHACALVEGAGDPPPLRPVCWGSNANSQLGAGLDPATVADTMTPVDVAGPADNVSIVAGNGHSCVLPATPGTPQCWGFNETGQVGNATTATAATPVVVAGSVTNATKLSAHGALGSPSERGHTCARLADGTARCWGRNADGQLGDGTNTDRSTPVAVKYDHDGDPSTAPVVLTGITSVTTGGFHSCARMDDARVRCWGDNSARQLGTVSTSDSNLAVVAVYDHDADPSTDPVALDATTEIAAGLGHTCVAQSTGSYRCWGDNSQGQLGDGSTTDRPFATLVTGIPQPLAPDTNARAITAGDNHTCAVLSNTSVRCWGDNSAGQLGTGSTSDFSATPVEPVGLGDEAANEAKPISGFYVGNVSAGRNNTCASRVDKAVVCWGDNAHGQLGYGFGNADGTDARSPIAVNVLTGAVGGNLVPTPKDDTYTTSPGFAVAIEVSTNDTDMDGDTLTFAVTEPPDHGTVAPFSPSNGVGLYTPAPGYCGPDSFTYTASDGVAASPAQVSITVTCPNNGPTADDDTASGAEDTPVTIDVLGNDSDPEGDALSITAVTAPASGGAAIAGNEVAYTPNANFCGVDTFDYTVADAAPGNTDDIGTVTVSVSCVNDPPVANDNTVAATEDTAVAVDVVADDTDAEDPTALVVLSVSAPASGTAAIVSSTAVTYTPNVNHCDGTDAFTYTVADPDGGTDIGTVTVTGIACVGDSPSAVDDQATTPEDTPVSVAVLANDSDADGEALTVVSATNGANGTTTTDGVLVTYSPATNFCGADTFTYTAQDTSGATAAATVTVNVTCGNDGPVANPDNVVTDEDVPIGISPLANDVDADGDTITLTSIGDPAHGGAVVQVGGGVLYEPDPDYCGSDTFTYTVSDGNGSFSAGVVTITITCVNDAPQLGAIADRTTEWGVPVALTATATDPDSAVTYSLVSPPAGASIDPSTGAFTWTPATEQIGDHMITVRASDGTAHDEEAFTVTVTGRATTLVYGGALSGDYSDPVTVSATLTDAGGGVGGKTIRFAVGPQEVVATTAPGTGVASATITLDGVAGPTTVSASFAGDGLHAAASSTEPFTVTKETLTTTYTGTHHMATTAATASVTLSVALAEPADGSPGAGPAGAKVDFRTTGGVTLCSATATATAAGSASATCLAPNRPLGSEAVIAQVIDSRYRSDVDVSAFTVAQATSGSASGAGRVGSATPDSFAFSVRPAKRTGPPSGDAVHVYRSGANVVVVSSSTIGSFTRTCSGGKAKVCSAQIQASGAERRSVALATGAVTFLSSGSWLTIDAEDRAEPNGAGTDTYGVTLSAPDNRTIPATPIAAGNIRIV